MIESCRRILMIKPSALGDIVHGLPVLHGLRVACPHAHIAWMVRPAFAEVIRGHRDLDEVIEFDRKHFGRIGRSWAATRDFVGWINRLRRQRFDLVVDLQGLFRSGFFSLMTFAPRRYGFAAAREGGWLFYNHRIAAGDAVHAVDRNYRFAEPLGFAHVEPTFELPISEQDQASADRLLVEAGVAEGQRFAAISPGSMWESKRWPAERFAQVADELARQGLPAVLLGSPQERGVADAVVAAAAGSRPIDLVGRTAIKQAMAILRRSAIVITNDSGPMHLAAALGQPMVAIFGPTDPARTGPYRRPDAVVRVAQDTRHDFRHHDNSAIAAVGVDLVLAAARRQLAGEADVGQ